tara:strand:- start:256 stop:975 length:720 start_codon:yes stop_codon:yes gene_type:complete
MFNALSDLTDKLLGFIMWPLAFVVIYYYPDIFSLFTSSAGSYIKNVSPIQFAGAIFFITYRFNFLPFLKFPTVYNSKGRFSWGQRLDTFEHELVHWIFSVLTFKFGSYIELLKEPSEKGHAGYCYISRGGNWLITIGPYFLPTFTIVLCLLYLIPYKPMHPFLDFALGYSISFHILQNIVDVLNNWSIDVEDSYTDLTTLTSPYPNQTSWSVFRSRIFAIIMIPALNLITFSYIFKIIQ